MGRVVDQASASIESPVFAPSVARMFPCVRLTSLIIPSVPPTATTVLDGLMAREVSGPASKRASIVSTEFVNRTFCSYFPGYSSGLRSPTD